jgi:hypothetical protein
MPSPSVESQYLVGSSSPSGHSINSHSSGLIVGRLSSRWAPRTRTRANRDDSISALPSPHLIVRQARLGCLRAFKRTRRGRPGPNTAYRKITKRRFDIEWTTDEEAIAYDHESDGMYPLCRVPDHATSNSHLAVQSRGPLLFGSNRVGTITALRGRRAGSRPVDTGQGRDLEELRARVTAP